MQPSHDMARQEWILFILCPVVQRLLLVSCDAVGGGGGAIPGATLRASSPQPTRDAPSSSFAARIICV